MGVGREWCFIIQETNGILCVCGKKVTAEAQEYIDPTTSSSDDSVQTFDGQRTHTFK